MMKRARKESPVDEDKTHALPPSIKADEPLLSSYSYHSDVPDTLLDSKVMMGVDEAGRGPVLGMIYPPFQYPLNLSRSTRLRYCLL